MEFADGSRAAMAASALSITQKPRRVHMALHHARSGELIDIRALGAAIKNTPSQALVRADQLELLGLNRQAGGSLPRNYIGHSAIAVQCLERALERRTPGTARRMERDTLVYLAPGVEHSVVALEDCSVLVPLFLDRSRSGRV